MSKRILFWTWLIGCAGVAPIAGQQLPPSDILLFSLNLRSDSVWHPFGPRFLTAFNPKGYNNQPQFFSPFELYLTVQEPSDTTQTDIYALDLLLNTLTRVTATRTPEYSPNRMPDGRHFSVVRVEADGSQRLWALPLDRRSNGYLLLPNLSNVGYHCWLRDSLIAVFLVEADNRHSLALASPSATPTRRIATHVGRCLQKVGTNQLAFVQKTSDTTSFLKRYDLHQHKAETLIAMPNGSEDFAVLPDGSFLAGQGSRLLQFHPRRQTSWQEIAQLSAYGVQKITRIAVSPDGRLLAVVVQ